MIGLNMQDYMKRLYADYIKIKFSSDDNLPLNKSIKFLLMTIIIRCVFKEDNKLDPQVF